MPVISYSRFLSCLLSCSTLQHPVCQDACPEPTTSLEPRLNALIAEGVVHPITRVALLGAGKAHALNLKLDTNQGVEVRTRVNTLRRVNSGRALAKFNSRSNASITSMAKNVIWP